MTRTYPPLIAGFWVLLAAALALAVLPRLFHRDAVSTGDAGPATLPAISDTVHQPAAPETPARDIVTSSTPRYSLFTDDGSRPGAISGRSQLLSTPGAHPAPGLAYRPGGLFGKPVEGR